MTPHIQLRHDPLAPDSWWSVPWIATAIVLLAIGLFVFFFVFFKAEPQKKPGAGGPGFSTLNSHGRGIRMWQKGTAISDRLPRKRCCLAMGSQPRAMGPAANEEKPGQGIETGLPRPVEMSSGEDGPSGRMPSQRPGPLGSSGSARARDVPAHAHPPERKT